LSFAAYSASGKDISIGLIDPANKNYGLSYTAPLVSSWQVFSSEFTTKNFASNVSDGYLYFWPVAADTFYIDNVIMEKVIPPAIIIQPADLNVDLGQTATFSVVATGTAPLTYQWQKNGTNIPGETTAAYTTPSASTTGDNGSTFQIIVSNSQGRVTSN